MHFEILTWEDLATDKLRDLYVHFPYPAYFGSSIVDERLQDYRFRCVQKAEEANPGTLLVVSTGDRILCAAQLRRIDHLSNHFGIEVFSIANEAYVSDNDPVNYTAFLMLIRALRDRAERGEIVFITATAASQAFQWIRALEGNCFRYADAFRHVTSRIDEDYSTFLRPDLVIRDPIESDFEEIAYSYAHMPFPNHLLHEPEFDKEKVIALYVKRYKEVNEGLGQVFVGEWNGQFAGALNGIIDRDIQSDLGVVVNHLSQGVIVHPRAAGRGVALALMAYRQVWYREQGIKQGYFGSNINNLHMIKGMEKMRTRHAGVEINLILRVKKTGSKYSCDMRSQE